MNVLKQQLETVLLVISDSLEIIRDCLTNVQELQKKYLSKKDNFKYPELQMDIQLKRRIDSMEEVLDELSILVASIEITDEPSLTKEEIEDAN